MPQPLNRAAPRAGIAIGQHSLSQRPKLAELVAGTIGAWSYTELILGNLLSKMLGTSAPEAMAMYAAMGAFQPQMRALDAAAATAFADSDKDLYDATMFVVRRAAKQRHIFAHNVWATCPELPEALLLVEPSVLWQWVAAVSAYQLEQLKQPKGAATPMPLSVYQFDNSKVAVYRAEDFQNTIARINRAALYVTWLSFLTPHPGPEGDSIRRLLRSETEIRSALDRSSRDQTKQLSALPPMRVTTDVY